MKGTKKESKTIVFWGFTKREDDGRFVSVCINLSLTAQGKTAEESVRKLTEAIDVYLDYKIEKYPDNWEQKIYRSSHPDLIKEFEEIEKEVLKLRELQTKAEENLATRKQFMPIDIGTFNFAQTISPTQTKTGLHYT